MWPYYHAGWLSSSPAAKHLADPMVGVALPHTHTHRKRPRYQTLMRETRCLFSLQDNLNRKSCFWSFWQGEAGGWLETKPQDTSHSFYDHRKRATRIHFMVIQLVSYPIIQRLSWNSWSLVQFLYVELEKVFWEKECLPLKSSALTLTNFTHRFYEYVKS